MGEITGIPAVALSVLALLTAFEWIGWFLLSKRVYRFGILVLRQTRDIPVPGLPSGTQFDTATGDFLMSDSGLLLFRHRLRPFELRFNSPLTAKGAIRWQNGSAVVEVRLVVFPFLLFAFLGLWAALQVAAEVAKSGGGVGLLLVALWFLALCGFMGAIARGEFNSLMIVLQEFEQRSAADVGRTSAST